MPYMYMNLTTQEEFDYVAKEMVHELSDIFKINVDWFVFIKNDSQVVKNKVNHTIPFIEIKCFERSEEQIKMMGNLLLSRFKEKWKKEIEVFFIFIEKKNYFEF